VEVPMIVLAELAVVRQAAAEEDQRSAPPPPPDRSMTGPNALGEPSRTAAAG
jgi:hypothetical protein